MTVNATTTETFQEMYTHKEVKQLIEKLCTQNTELKNALFGYHEWFVSGSIFALTVEQIKKAWENSYTKERAERLLGGENL